MKKQGISLIVLVITIIVMVTLTAAVALSLNNSGIIGKADVAVGVTNKKQVEDLAALAWAEAYMEGARTDEELKSAVNEALKDIDTSKYTIEVSKKGVSVVDEPEPVLNEYGFYFNEEYALTDRCFIGNYLTYIFKEDGSIEAKVYNDATYSKVLLEGLGEPAGTYVYSEGLITCATGTIIPVNNGRMLRGSDIDLSYDTMLLEDYRKLIKGVEDPVVFAVKGVKNESFVAETGMTWEDFVTSKYNKDNFFYVENNVVYTKLGQIHSYLVTGVDGITRPGEVDATKEITIMTYDIWTE